MIDEVCDVGNRKVAIERFILIKYGINRSIILCYQSSVVVIGGILFVIYLVKIWLNGKINFVSEFVFELVIVS